MFYRLHLLIATTNPDTLDDIKDKVLDHWAEAKTINPGTPHSEPSSMTIEQCYHDADPTKPCDQLFVILTLE